MDSFILVQFSQNAFIFNLYNANTLSLIKSWGSIGRAGIEYIFPHIIKYDDGRFVIWEKSYNRMEFYNIPDFIPFNIIETKEVKDLANSISYAGNSFFVYERLYPNDISLHRWDPGKEPTMIISLKDDYAAFYQNSSVYEGFLEADESNKRVIYAFQFMDGFDIFDMNGNPLRKVRRKNSSTPTLKDNGGIDRVHSKNYYLSIKKGKKSFFIYRVGFTSQDMMGDLKITYIEEFDWNGNPLRRYELPAMLISGFDILQDNHFLVNVYSSEDAPLQIFSY